MKKEGWPEIPYKIQITLISAEGKCPNGHKVGDKWIVNRKSPEPPICLAAFCNLITPTRILETGGSIPMYPDPDSFKVYCPDTKNKLIFEMRRLPEQADDPSGMSRKPKP